MNEKNMLHVEGRKLLTEDGTEVWLQGLALPGLEWANGWDHIDETLEVALTDWKVNCIRLPIREDFWYGLQETTRADGGASYREMVSRLVERTATHDVWIALDLHRFKAPTQAHADFWQDLATRYANHPAVIFDLFNEAHGITWDVWRDGGDIRNEPKPGVVVENNQAEDLTQSIGMQALIDIVRKTGAKNIVIAGGLDWAYDLSAIADGYALDDRGGNGIMYATHIYPWKDDWQGKVCCMIDKAPLFLGEVGCELIPMPFEKPEMYQDPYVWAPDMIGFIQKHRLNWTAWSFHPRATPLVISDWKFTPSPYWGSFVRAALRGVRFECARMR